MSRNTFKATYEAAIERLETAIAAAGRSITARSIAIRDALTEALADPRSAGEHVVERVSECVAAAVGAVRSAGGRVVDGVRGAMLGVMHGTADEHVWATDTIEQVSAAFMRHAIECREDPLPVCRAAIDAAREAATELGVSVDEAAVAAARGAVRAAGEHGPDLRREVEADLRRMLPETAYHLVTVRSSNGGK